MRYLKRLAQVGIGIAILLWVLQLADSNEVLHVILHLDSPYIILASVFFMLASVMVSFTLYVSLKSLGLTPSLRNVIMASFAGQLLSDITPARSGYLLTPLILNKMDDTSVKSGMAAVATMGVVNLFVRAILSSIALAYFVRFLPLGSEIVNALLIGIFLLMIGGLGLLALVSGKHLIRVVERFTKLPVVGRAITRVVKSLNDLQEEGEKVKGFIAYIALTILLSIMANAIALYLVSAALCHNPPNLLDFILLVPLASALMYIPITIAGLGVQETGYVVFLTLLGMPIEKATAFALITRLLFTGTDVIGLQPLLKVGIKA